MSPYNNWTYQGSNIMKQLIGIILAFAVMGLAEDDMHNGTGFFVNSDYLITA